MIIFYAVEHEKTKEKFIILAGEHEGEEVPLVQMTPKAARNAATGLMELANKIDPTGLN